MKGRRRYFGGPSHQGRIDLPYLAFGRGDGVPVVAGGLSGVQVMAVRSYLKPGALFNASFVALTTGYHLLLSFVLNCTTLETPNGEFVVAVSEMQLVSRADPTSA
jgi:hypothetical protein